MSVKVKLSDIVEAMEMQSSMHSHYLDRQTGEIHMLSEEEMDAAESENPVEDYPDWQQPLIEKAREILDDTDEQRYIALPTQFDIHEWSIMQDFALSLSDDRKSEELLDAIHGSGAFRLFRKTIDRFGLFDQWHQFREARFRDIARRWCEEHHIPYVDE
ncbi:MAG: UPF0158 family protein [candidate division KSB1 bacterium]|nr:UPF0158 family protein [candidate division KSB1 bacterium]